MFCRIIQNMAMVCIVIGISGIAGAIARDTGLAQSVILFLSGSAIMYLAYKTEKDKHSKSGRISGRGMRESGIRAPLKKGSNNE